jgi:hypothetical protein
MHPYLYFSTTFGFLNFKFRMASSIRMRHNTCRKLSSSEKKIIYQYSYRKTKNHLRMTYRDEPKDGDWNVNGEAVPVQTQLNRKISHP